MFWLERSVVLALYHFKDNNPGKPNYNSHILQSQTAAEYWKVSSPAPCNRQTWGNLVGACDPHHSWSILVEMCKPIECSCIENSGSWFPSSFLGCGLDRTYIVTHSLFVLLFFDSVPYYEELFLKFLWFIVANNTSCSCWSSLFSPVKNRYNQSQQFQAQPWQIISHWPFPTLITI